MVIKFCNQRIMGMINALALLLVILTANSACIWVAYQPEFPKEAEKFAAKRSKSVQLEK